MIVGSSFVLHSEKKSSNNVEYYRIKLTESSLKEIQSAAGTVQKIFLTEKNGQIIIGDSTYNFSVAEPLAKDANRNVEVVRTDPKSKHGLPNVCVLGTLTKRLTVHAKDDVFDATRAKIAQVDIDAKKICTKELEPVRGGSALRKKMPPPGKLPPNKRRLKSSNNMTTAAVAPLSSSLAANRRSQMASFPLKKRILHLLAVHMYNKAELILRLTQDSGGLNEEEKLQLNSLLAELGKVERNGGHSLRPGLFSEVDVESWPGYNDKDRETVRRRIEAFKTSQLASSENKSSEMKKRSSTAASLETTASWSTPSKKSMSMPPPTASSAMTKSPTGTVALPLVRPTSLSLRSDPTNNIVEEKKLTSASSASESSLFMAMDRVSCEETSPLSVLSACSPLSETDLDRVRYNSEQLDAQSEAKLDLHYPPVENAAQRLRYKLDFSKDYPVYKELWKRVEQQAKKIHNWDRQLQNEEVGSSRYKKLENEVFEFYTKLRSDVGTLQDLQQANFLHRKLKLIKQRLHAFRNLPPNSRLHGGVKPLEVPVAAW